MLGQTNSSFWMPTEASTYAGNVDWVFYFILSIAAFFFTVIAVTLVLFVVRYRRRPGHHEQPTATHSLGLELTWSIIPLILVIVIFIFGFKGFMDMVTPPANSYEILVTAAKWNWLFTYPNGHVDANLHVPVNRPVRLVLTSQDVIHSLYVPAFRIKKDCVPGRFNKAWFEATKINTDPGYDLFCAEYCGTKHSEMIAKVYVHEPTDFAKWLEDASHWEGRMTPAQRGAGLYRQRGCQQCHSLDGTNNIGPTFKNLWDHVVEGSVTFRDGTRLSSLFNDNYTPEDYIRESIYKPEARFVAGFNPAMPTYQGQVKENDIPAMIAFFKSLSDKYKAEAEQPAATQGAASKPASTQPATGPAGS